MRMEAGFVRMQKGELMSDTQVKCVDCANHSVLFGQDWCDGINGKSYRLTAKDVVIDAPCTYYKPIERRTNETD